MMVAPSLAQDDPTVVTWLMLGWGGAEEVIAAFEAENPDIDVELEQVPFNALFEQIQVRLQADSVEPDVISVDVPLVAGYGLRGWLLPLDEYFIMGEQDDWLDAAVGSGQLQRRIAGGAGQHLNAAADLQCRHL